MRMIRGGLGVLVLCVGTNAWAQLAQAPGANTQVSTDGSPAKAWQASVLMDHGFGTGNFLANSAVREQNNRIVQTWMLGGGYDFKLLGQGFNAGISSVFSVLLTEPKRNPDRRFDPQWLSLSLSWEGWTEKHTGIHVSFSSSLLPPFSYSSWKDHRILDWQNGLSLNRSFGKFNINVSSLITKSFNSYSTSMQQQGVARESNITRNVGDSVVEIGSGQASPNFDLWNSITLTYRILPSWVIGYRLGVINAFRYALTDKRDAFTSPNADAGPGREDLLTYAVWTGYSFAGKNRIQGLPVDLTCNVGIRALHGAQSDDNKKILWPLFYPAFAENRAANNYGSAYVQIAANF